MKEHKLTIEIETNENNIGALKQSIIEVSEYTGLHVNIEINGGFVKTVIITAVCGNLYRIDWFRKVWDTFMENRKRLIDNEMGILAND